MKTKYIKPFKNLGVKNFFSKEGATPKSCRKKKYPAPHRCEHLFSYLVRMNLFLLQMQIEVIGNLLIQVYTVFSAYVMLVIGIQEIIYLFAVLYAGINKFHAVLHYHHIVLRTVYK